MKVTERNHIFDSLNGRDMHWLEASAWSHQGLISFVVDQRDLLRVGGAHFGPDGYVEFTSLFWIDPNEVALDFLQNKSTQNII